MNRSNARRLPFRLRSAGPVRILAAFAFTAPGSGCGDLLGSRGDRVAHVWISHSAFEMDVGDTLRVSAWLRGGGNEPSITPDRYPLEWTSSDPAIARVNPQGLLTATGPGRATLTVRAGGRADMVSLVVGTSAERAIRWGSVHTGREFTCALTEGDGERYCWGANPFGGHGNGDRRMLSGTYAPLATGDPIRYRSLTLGTTHGCGLALDGTGYCWGTNSGRPTDYELLPQRLSTSGPLTSIESGAFHSCALRSDGARVCWGSNLFGALGVQTQSARQVAPMVVSEALRFTRLSGGLAHSCGISTTGEAYCWGSAQVGELGEGSAATLRMTPTRVLGGHRFAEVSAGIFSSCALTDRGVGYCWGINVFGNLLSGDGQFSAAPVRLETELRFAQLEVGGGHLCGLTVEGHVYCWGRNESGQAGVDPETGGSCANPLDGGWVPCALVPIRVAAPLQFRQISLAATHTCGVTVDAEVYCWGSNRFGELGGGRVVPYSADPLRVSGAFH
jgi:alpha-tubulin suppressor-like RCC1 family protein